MKEMVGGCCVCSDERGWPDNALVYCDGNGCTVAVHQACYGIVAVPAGPWYCRKCEISDRTQRVRCALCPSRSGALKRADTGGWAHVVCALYIPEVRFGNVTSMEPIILQLIPPERYNKTCYICQESGKHRRAAAGACMQCNKSGCKQQFHVTCAQGLGLLCEEAGNYLDNVKYCGYCQHHYGKLKKGSTVKTPFKPIHDSQSSDSSGEREDEDANAPGDATGPSTSTGAAANSRTKSRKSSSSVGPTVKNAPNPSRSSSVTPTASGEKGKKSSPVGDSSRRGSVASESSPVAAASKADTPAPSPQHQPTGGDQSSQPINKATSHPTLVEYPPTSGPLASQEPCIRENAPLSVETSLPTTVISSTEYLENKHTKKRKAASQSNAASAAEYQAPPPTFIQAHHIPTPPISYAEVPMEVDITDKTKKAKIDSPVIVSPATLASPGQQASPGHRSRPANVANARSPNRGKGERELATSHPSLLVSVPLPSTSHDLGFSQGQAPGPSGEAMSGHSYYQLQHKQAQQPLPPGSNTRLTWGSLSLYDMQQQDPAGLKPADKRIDPNPMPVPVRNKKRAAMTNSVMAHNVTVPGPQIQLSPGAMNSTSKLSPLPPLPAPPPPPPPVQERHTYQQESPAHSPGAGSRPISLEQQRIQIANSLGPHLLGNELNLNSTAAECLQEQLNAELAAHGRSMRANSPPLLAPPVMSSRNSTSSSSGGTQTLEQLLERQWEQGSQYIMERAKNFDIASLLSCLHQLRTENVRLEEQISTLSQRKETLLAVNARLANPLNAGTAPSPESGRCSRDNSCTRVPSVMRTDAMNPERPQVMMQPKPS